MKMVRSFPSLIVVITAILTAGCQTLKDGLDLSQQIAVKFKQGAKISINSHGNLVITFENSPLADLPAEERRQFAHSVARFAFQHYAHSEALNTIGVVFQSQRAYGPIKIGKAYPMYMWKVAELKSTADDTTLTLTKHKI
jgi:hypothetical protein